MIFEFNSQTNTPHHTEGSDAMSRKLDTGGVGGEGVKSNACDENWRGIWKRRAALI